MLQVSLKCISYREQYYIFVNTKIKKYFDIFFKYFVLITSNNNRFFLQF